jgi:predicted amidohydrolase YtcJ
VVLAEDPHSADKAKIKDIKIVCAATAGRVVYEN